MLRRVFSAAVLFAAVTLPASDRKPPNITLRDLSGKKVQLRDYRGRIVVLNFWATWCGPCREEMPMLVEAAKAWEPAGVAFIAVSLDDEKTRKDIPAFVERYHASFPVWVGASSDELNKLELGSGVPDTAFIDERGTVVARVLGEIHRPEIDARLSWLTGDRKSPPPPPLVNHMPRK